MKTLYKRTVILCPMCWERGSNVKEPSTIPKECSDCNGTGRIVELIYHEPFTPIPVEPIKKGEITVWRL